VHALANVDDLRDAAVADHRRQREASSRLRAHLLAAREVHASRVAIFIASLRSCRNVAIQWVAVSMRGHSSFIVLANDRWMNEPIPRIERREVHLAVALATVRVPVQISAPLTKTG